MALGDPMRRLARWGVAVGVVFLGLVLLVASIVWMTIPVNAPWRSMLQQMSLLPSWLDPSPMSSDRVEAQLVVADGYGVSLFAAGVADARGLRVTAAGDMLVSAPRDGRILLLDADRDGDGSFDGRRVLLEDLTRPNGLDVSDGYLYVGEEDGVGRIAFDPWSGTTDGEYPRIIDGLPRGGCSRAAAGQGAPLTSP